MEREIEFLIGETLESVVYTLLTAKARGEKVYGKFNGHILHSDTISMDSAYIEVCGCTKAEHDKKMEEWLECYKQEEKMLEQMAIQNISKWIKIGKMLISPERYEEWEKCVNDHATGIYHGLEIDSALEIMQALENGATIEEAINMFNSQGHSGVSAELVRNIISSFSRKGQAFLEALAYHAMSSENKVFVKSKKQETI